MTNIQMNDTWLENIFFAEFKGDSVSFLDNYKSLLSEKRRRERKIVSLLQQYKNAEISIGKIADKLYIDRDEVLSLMEKHNIYLVDYDWNKEKKTLEKYLVN